MSFLSILIAFLLALVGVKLLLNVGMMIEAGSYDPEGLDPPRGYSLMPVEPVPLLLASVLGLVRFDWWADAVVLFVVGMVVIVASYPLGLVLGRLVYLWRR